jgi:hypothetical protein
MVEPTYTTQTLDTTGVATRTTGSPPSGHTAPDSRQQHGREGKGQQ